jgi:photosystem II stability/assembly factor-like uncharacterized protein
MKKHFFIPLISTYLCISINVTAQWIAVDSIESAVLNISTSGGKLFVCSATSGIYISADSGVTFNPSNNGLANLNTRVIRTKDSLLILGTNQSIYKSIDLGTTWILSSNGVPANTGSNVEDIIFKGDSILVATYGNGIFCSTDYCQNWFTLNNGFTDLYRSCLFVNGNRLFTGTKFGGSGIYISDDNGLSWVPKNNGVPTMFGNPNKYVDITAFTNIGPTIFASTLGGNILKSEDNGENWNILANPNNYQWTIFSSGWTLLAGHDGVGVSRSDDSGNSWNFENEGLISINDKDIRTFCILGSYIYTGGWSQKVFRRPVNEIISGIQENHERKNIVVYPNPGTEHLIIESGLQVSGSQFTFYSIEGKPIIHEFLKGLKTILDSHFLQPGTYIWQVEYQNKIIETGKWIKPN